MPGAATWALLLLATGCGELHFTPSPYTPQYVELLYSAQEHITVVRWRVDAVTPVAQTRFELLATDGSYTPIDFSQSVFPGGIAPCTDGVGACAQYVLRGNYSVLGPGARPVQAVHDLYGVLPGGVATTETVPETISFKSFFHSGNDIVYVNITDAVASKGAYKFPRSYDRAMWATSGLCVSDVVPSAVSFSPLDQTGGFAPPLPLTDKGTYCVATRPLPSDSGDTTLLQQRIATLPEVMTGRQTFAPDVERSPIIYQIVLDLEIPVPDRCTDAIQKIEDLVQRYFGNANVPVHKLATINLSKDPTNPCSQSNDRVINPTEMAQGVKQLVATQTGPHQQYHLMYFNNLDTPLPPALRNSFETLFAAFSTSPPGYELQLFSWLFSPLGPAVLTQPELHWWAFWVWQTPDMNFQMKLGGYVQDSLPYTSQVHDPSEPVLLLAPDVVTANEDHWIKLCNGGSPPVQPYAQLPNPHYITMPAWKITSADPPAYLVTLPQQIIVNGSSFVENDAIVDYQICTRYCEDHPYVDTSQTGQLSWTDSLLCASESF